MDPSLFFLSGKRTPFGANGGSLREVSPTELGATAARAALEQAGVRPEQVDHVIFGNVLQATGDAIYLPRHIGLKTGVPEEVPALGLNRLCGTGFQAIVEAQLQMAVGDTEIALVGGVENLSLAPYVARGARWGMRLGHQPLTDVLLEGLFDPYAQLPMALTAENLGDRYGVTREQSDEFALRSQRLCAEARVAGRFSEEIVSFGVVDRRGQTRVLDQDEHPKPDATMEGLAKLKPIFKKGGMVTAGNASGIVDGAAALVVCTERAASRGGFKPLGRLVSYGVAGCDPKIMGIGPVPAARIALKRAALSLADVDLVEVNEAFAPQTIAVERELGIPREKLNVNGGAIAIGHPFAASGARITLHALYELRRRRAKRALVSACIGGGQGIALVVEAFA